MTRAASKCNAERRDPDCCSPAGERPRGYRPHGTVLVAFKGHTSSIPIVCLESSAMFTVGQTIVLGLAGSIYVVGAAFLLGGRAVLNSGGRVSSSGDGGQVVRPGTIDGAPHFVPALDSGAAKSHSVVDGGSPNKGMLPARSHARSEGATGPSKSLKAPLCLN